MTPVLCVVFISDSSVRQGVVQRSFLSGDASDLCIPGDVVVSNTQQGVGERDSLGEATRDPCCPCGVDVELQCSTRFR